VASADRLSQRLSIPNTVKSWAKCQRNASRALWLPTDVLAMPQKPGGRSTVKTLIMITGFREVFKGNLFETSSGSLCRTASQTIQINTKIQTQKYSHCAVIHIGNTNYRIKVGDIIHWTGNREIYWVPAEEKSWKKGKMRKQNSQPAKLRAVTRSRCSLDSQRGFGALPKG
jgi:hypothetical protein